MPPQVRQGYYCVLFSCHSSASGKTAWGHMAFQLTCGADFRVDWIYFTRRKAWINSLALLEMSLRFWTASSPISHPTGFSVNQFIFTRLIDVVLYSGSYLGDCSYLLSFLCSEAGIAFNSWLSLDRAWSWQNDSQPALGPKFSRVLSLT